mmetsp:Transcript_145494/g.253944  ORF Transcript_145494/g.253944 Transcript_145494/m.253944 type:complete len:93 (+) Transcript_145494:262-540(+)
MQYVPISTPILTHYGLAALGGNAHAAAEYANPQPGGLGTKGEQTKEWSSRFFSDCNPQRPNTNFNWARVLPEQKKDRCKDVFRSLYRGPGHS